MPTSPVTPSQLLATIPTPSGNFCEKFLRFLIDGPTLIHQWFESVYKEDGNFTDDFKEMLCGIDCSAIEEGSSTLAAPTVTIANGATPRVSWGAVPNAGYYEVLRGTTSDIIDAALIGVTTLTFLDDTTTSASIQYYWWVRAVTASAQGPFSAPAMGGQAVYTLTAPTIIDSTDNIAAYVKTTWSRIPAATLYDVIRNTSNTTVGATALGTTSECYWNDFTAVFGTAYYFFVRSRSPIATSAYSTGNTGERA